MADKTLACKGTGPDSFCENEEDFDWDSEDEREIENCAALSSSIPALVGREAVVHSRAKVSSLGGSSGTKLIDHFIGMGFSVKAVAEAIREYGEENSDLILEVLLKDSAGSSDHSTGSAGSNVVNHFVGMGFSKEMVAKVIQEHGDSEETDSILETLLTYLEIERHPREQPPMDSDRCSVNYGGSFLEDFSDLEDSVSEAFSELESDEESGSPLACLTRMGYTKDEASIAIERCGAAAPLSELTDFILASQWAKADDHLYPEEKPKPKHVGDYSKKRSLYECDIMKRNKQMRLEKNLLNGDDEVLRLPNPMIGFGVPTEPGMVTQRTLPEAAKGPPFFYYENVALAPKGVWQTISRCLYDVEPEFVDSKYFCAAARKRGYVHNLPIHNRFPLFPLPNLTIHEAFLLTKRWWPSWDPRTKLNCLQTSVGSAKLTERIHKAVEEHEGVPPLRVQEYVLNECRKWNLVWVGKNKVAPLEPDEFEMLLGFPRNHTRGGGISMTDRYKSLGNSFQVDTVAYHLSALKDLFPDGISILSLFSGIGGAEVALHKLGIRLKNVVSVEIFEVNRGIQRCWWEQTNQTGNLIDIPDVQQLDASRLEELMSMFGGFDLVVGGSPCNNLAGSNRLHRDGLEGKESSLFYDYCRILDLVKSMMNRNR